MSRDEVDAKLRAMKQRRRKIAIVVGVIFAAYMVMMSFVVHHDLQRPPCRTVQVEGVTYRETEGCR